MPAAPYATRLRRARPILIATLALLLVAGGAAAWLLTRPAPPPAVDRRVSAGDLELRLRLDQPEVGERTIEVLLRDASGQPVAAEQVELRFTMPGMDMGEQRVQAEPSGEGGFRARGSFFSMAGRWRAEVTVRRAGAAELIAPFDLAIAAPGELSGALNPLQPDPPTLAAGRLLYQSNCAACHGDAGRGDGPSAAGMTPRPADFAQHMQTGLHTDGQVFAWIEQGYPGGAMPGWGGRLSEQQIWQLVTYLRTFGASATQPTLEPYTPVPVSEEALPPLVFVRSGNLWRSAGDGSPPRQLTSFPPENPVQHPAVSPDGRSVAFVVFATPSISSTSLVPPSALFVVSSEGGAPQPLWQPTAGNVQLPAWSADGSALYVSANGVPLGGAPASAGLQLDLVRLDLRDGSGQIVAERALDASLSRDGRRLVFLRLEPDGSTLSIYAAEPDGSAARRVLAGDQFTALYAPRLAPDGTTIVFAASGGPATGPDGRVADAAPGLWERLAAAFEPPAAEAHGAPWDIWSVGVDGAGLRRLTKMYEDTPMPAWSPDGRQIAVLGGGGMYLMDADGSRLRRIDPGGDHGGLDWPRS